MATAEHVIKIDPHMTAVYTMQAMFQSRLLDDILPHELGDDARMAYLREQALALIGEVHEALAETGWKSWAEMRPTNRLAYVEELADVFIFLMNMMLVEDVRPTELLNTVTAKIAKNIKRQNDGYRTDATTKCPECKRSYDGAGVSCSPGDGREINPSCADALDNPDVMTRTRRARGGRGAVDQPPGKYEMATHRTIDSPTTPAVNSIGTRGPIRVTNPEGFAKIVRHNDEKHDQ